MKTAAQYNEERLKLVHDMRAMQETREKDGKLEFSAEDQAKYNAMREDEKKILALRDEAVRIEAIEKDLTKPTREPVRPGLNNEVAPEDFRATAEYGTAFRALLKAKGAFHHVRPEFQATLQKGVSTQGGYTVPIEYEKQILMKMYDANIMRQLCSVIRTTSQVDIPMEGSLPTWGWIAELGTYGQTDTTFAQVVLGAYKLGGIMTVSEELLQDSFIDIPVYIAGRAATAAGFAEETAYLTGDGNGKPTGLVTTAVASSTSVTSGSNATVTSADMFSLMYSLARPYRKNASFLVADSVINKLRQEKSTTGQYLWMPALTANAPDVYLGKPIYTSDFLAALAASSVSAIFGDFSYYQIVDRIGWSMQQLNELYAATGMVGFRMWERTDGKLLRPEAFSILTTHA